MRIPVRPVEVNALGGYWIWLSYSDGTTGEVDLSHLAGRGVFRLWENPASFRKPKVTPHGSIAWDGDVELCPDALYMWITGKTVEELMPRAQDATVNA